MFQSRSSPNVKISLEHFYYFLNGRKSKQVKNSGSNPVGAQNATQMHLYFLFLQLERHSFDSFLERPNITIASFLKVIAKDVGKASLRRSPKESVSGRCFTSQSRRSFFDQIGVDNTSCFVFYLQNFAITGLSASRIG